MMNRKRNYLHKIIKREKILLTLFTVKKEILRYQRFYDLFREDRGGCFFLYYF
jgi:hypothetical protein